MPTLSLTLADLAQHAGGILRFAGTGAGTGARAGEGAWAEVKGPGEAKVRLPNGAGEAATRVRAVTVDSRRLVRPGTAFFALRGGRADGHRFVGEALAAGCVAAVVAEKWAEGLLGSLPPRSPLVVIPTGGAAASGEAAGGEAAGGETASGAAAGGETASGAATNGAAASGAAASGAAASVEATSSAAASGEAAGGAAASGEAAGGGKACADPVLDALGRLAAWWRAQLAASGKTRVLAITGSNGKTTVKSALHAVLSRRYRVAQSPGSWNSRLGVALSLLGVEDDAEIALIEAGVSEPGDMAPLAAMIRPDLGLLTVIGTAHIGAFGDPDAIGREKLSLFRGLPPEGWLLLPDDPRCARLVEEMALPCAQVLFGPGAPEAAPVAVRRRSTTRALGQILRLQFPSREQYDLEVQDTSPAAVQNVAAAACAGALLGVEPVDIAEALGGFRPPPQRMETWQTPDGVTVINDCYSADPGSTDAALRALSQYPAGRRRIFVFGGMAGLGPRSDEEHEHVGRLASRVGVSVLLTVGERAGAGPAAAVFDGAVHRVASPGEAAQVLSKILRHGDVVLVKGPTEQRLDGLARALLESTAPTRLLVSLSAVESNLRLLRRSLGAGVKLCPIVKAEAYGGDPVRLSRFLERAGVDALGVAFAEEGVALRKAGIGLPLLVLSPGRGDAERLVQHRLTPVIHSSHGLLELEATAARLGRRVAVHLKVDTGMGRYGFFPEEVLPVARRVARSPHLHLEGLMTHFAAAEDPAEDDFTRTQIAAFCGVNDALRDAGIQVPLRHAAATAGALRFPEARFDMVRVGLGLYGISPSSACAELLPLDCAVAAVSRISSIKTFPPGHSIGYGRRYRVGSRPERIAFIPCGYHDAVWRDLYRGGGEVMVRGVRCPIVGTVSMDSAPINVSAVPEADVGDDVLLFGAWQGQVLPPEEVASRAGTVAHELLSGVGPRVPRIYQEG